MPDRIVRVGILTSEAVSGISFPAEVFYRRLMSVVDDFGRYDGRTAVLRAVLYPLQLGRVGESDIGKWTLETGEAGLVRQYHAGGKPFLEITKFGQKIRTKKSKWPDPPTSADNCSQVLADVPVVVDVVVGVVGGTKPRKRPIPQDFAVSEAVMSWASEHGFTKLDERLEAFRRKCKAKGYEYVDWDSAFMESIREDWAKLGKSAPSSEAKARADANFVGME